MRNYSRQREAILNVLRNTKSHPSANAVYEAVREEIPNISLGTVYRNLAQLSESGEILKIEVGDGFEHFDADCSFHIHLHCNGCGSINDLFIEHSEVFDLAEQHGFSPEKGICVLHVMCKNCKTVDTV